MNELKSEYALLSSEEYVSRVATFLGQASGWCSDRGLSFGNDVVTLREERLGEYDAPSLHISKDGVPLAKIIPVGAGIIGAHGRVDLIGRLARHPLLFFVEKGKTYLTQSHVGGQAASSSSERMFSGVDGEGWYWIEAHIRRPKRMDESLFLDLLTDVSDYEF
jgi:hypothetical protein